MIQQIVTDPVFLQQKSVPANRGDKQVMTDLLDTVRANAARCVGMAANMIGVRKTILVAQLSGEYVLLVNPRCVATAGEVYEAEEGCLSLTGTRSAKRYPTITVEYLDMRFRKQKQTFQGFEAQIIQHEMAHFDGILI